MRSRFLALALAASVAALPLAACSDSTTSLAGTATPAPSATADPLNTWLTPARQQLLLSNLQQLTAQAGWVAGCVFEKTADRSILSALKKPDGRAFYSEFTDPALGAALAARVEGTSAITVEFVGAAPNSQTYCYVPKPD